MRPAALAVVAALAASAAAATPPAPTRRVTDGAAFLSPAVRDAVDAKLAAYERATGHQVVVWIGRTVEGEPLADWAVRTFAAWKLGRAGQDDGVAIFVLADDRAIDLEVGYGLEARVPDAVAARIIADVMAPRLRDGDRDGAVTAGVDAVLAAIEGAPWSGPATGTERPAQPGPSTVELIVGGLGAVVFLVLLVKYPRIALLFLWAFARHRRDGGAGGAFHGGGGRSGGGGARTRW